MKLVKKCTINIQEGNYKLEVLFLFFFSFQLQSQTITVKGVVKDSLNQPLVYANVFAVPKEKDVNIAFAITNDQGNYKLKLEKDKSYQVTCSFLGYKKKEVLFKFNKDTIYNFILKEDKSQLEQVNITYTIPVTVKKDTITYNTDSFVTGNERKLKDVLKKLPGVEVDRNGNVLANGKKVTTLLVEDKPFFGGNTKLGVNNIPADAIDKVQVLDNYNSIAMLKGLQDNDKVALNIKLKENKKKFVFGDIEVGTGVKEKYLLHPKLFYYSPKTSVNFIGDINNNGEKSFTIKDYIAFEGGMSKLFSDASSYFKLYRSDFAKYLSNQDYKKDKTYFGAFNVRQSVSKATDLSLYVISAKSKTNTESTSTNTYLFDTPFSEKRSNTKQIDNFYTIGKITLDYNPSLKTDYAFSTVFNLTNSNSLGNINTIILTDNNTIETNASLDTYSFKQNMSLNNDLSKKHTLTFNARYALQKDKPNIQWNTNEKLLENLIPISIQEYYKIRQEKRIKSQNINALLKDYWSLHRFHHIYTSFGVNQAHTTFFNKDYQILDNYNINNFDVANFGNDFNHHFLDVYLGLEYKFKIGKVTFKPAVFYHTYQWSLQQLNEAKKRFSKNLLLPQFTTKITFRNSEKLSLKYKLNSQFASTKALLNNYILSSFNNVYKGNSELSNSLYHSINFYYYKFNLFRGYQFNISANYNKKIQSFKKVSELDGINQYSTQKMFFEPETNYSFNTTYSRTIHKIKAGLNMSYHYNDYFQIVNTVQNKNNNRSISFKPSIKTRFKKNPNIELGYKKDFTKYTNSNITNYTNEKLFAYLDYNVKDFIFEADFEYNSYKNKTDNNLQNDYINANASVFYQKEDSAWGFELNASNIFNASYKQSNSQSDFIISDSRTYILPRVIMLKIIYKL